MIVHQKVYAHPSPAFFNVGFTEDGVFCKKNLRTGEWEIFEESIVLSADGQKTYTQGNIGKRINRLAYECYAGEDLGKFDKTIFCKNHYLNDASLKNLEAKTTGSKSSRKGQKLGWSNYEKGNGWTLYIGTSRNAEAVFHRFDTEAEAREYFFKIVELNGETWLLGNSKRKMKVPVRDIVEVPEEASTKKSPVTFKEETEETLLFNKELPRWMKNPNEYTIIQTHAVKVLKDVYGLDVHYQRLGEWAEQGRGPKCKRQGKHWIYSFNSLKEWAMLSPEQRAALDYDPVQPVTALEETIKKARANALKEISPPPPPYVLTQPAENGVVEDLQKRTQQVEIENEQLKAQLITQAREFSEIKNSMTQLKSFLLEALK